MISLKLGAIIIGAFAAGAFVMSPVPQAIAAVIATDVQCTGCVGTADLAGNAVTAAKIKDNEVKAAEIAANAVGSSEIATNAVGAAELQGVTKLVFTECSINNGGSYPERWIINPALTICQVPDMTTSDSVIVTKEHGNTCFTLNAATPGDSDGVVKLYLQNHCDSNQTPGTITFSVIVYKAG